MTEMQKPHMIFVVIEDSDEDFETVMEAVKLAEVKAEVRRAVTGEGGLSLLRKLTQQHPIIVLMDLNTPGTDGREALVLLKSDPALKSIPVVVFSTSANPKDVGFCYAAGANAYHVKPVRYPDHRQLVIDLVRYWVDRVAIPAGETQS